MKKNAIYAFFGGLMMNNRMKCFLIVFLGMLAATARLLPLSHRIFLYPAQGSPLVHQLSIFYNSDIDRFFTLVTRNHLLTDCSAVINIRRPPL